MNPQRSTNDSKETALSHLHGSSEPADTGAGPAVDGVWRTSLGAVKVSLGIAALALAVAEVARARRGGGVGILGALGLYLQIALVSGVVFTTLRPLRKHSLGALAVAFLAGLPLAMLTLWLLKRSDLGNVTVLASVIALVIWTGDRMATRRGGGGE